MSELMPGASGKNEKNPQEDLSRLMAERDQLQLVSKSLSIEQSGRFSAMAEADQINEQPSAVHAGIMSEIIRNNPEGGVVSEEDKKRIEEAHQERMTETTDFSNAYRENDSVTFNENSVGLTGPLADKLESFGIDTSEFRKSNYVYGEDLRGAIAERLHEMTQGVNEKRLEVPGGKEEMVQEVLAAGISENAENYTKSITTASLSRAEMPVSIVADDMKEILGKNDVLSNYPHDVKVATIATLIGSKKRSGDEGVPNAEEIAEQVIAYTEANQNLETLKYKLEKKTPDFVSIERKLNAIPEDMGVQKLRELPANQVLRVQNDRGYDIQFFAEGEANPIASFNDSSPIMQDPSMAAYIKGYQDGMTTIAGEVLTGIGINEFKLKGELEEKKKMEDEIVAAQEKVLEAAANPIKVALPAA